MLPVDAVAFALQPCCHLAGSIERRDHVLAVNQFHQLNVILRDSCWLVIQPGATDIQQLTLTGHGERRTAAVNSSASLFYFHRSNPFSKKSFSTFSCPICW